MADAGVPRLRLRLDLAAGISFGPGKAALLQGIAETGSIAAAGRRIGMSYKRAWQLVDGLNRDFAAALVSTSRGGAHGGGAALTPLGAEVLAATGPWRRRPRPVCTMAWSASRTGSRPVTLVEPDHDDAKRPMSCASWVAVDRNATKHGCRLGYRRLATDQRQQSIRLHPWLHKPVRRGAMPPG
ncbi:winged helix-turn-helix domain-containing protein [Immundisolibacter sp.]|uniref:winged helix-turn-helix domain-containing protein n=1 Tax=Immundisolibacter sp. TaxID=1934948 RepID=UPI002B068B5C|nr:LysR family transcriptional regulator [Immundisolibacter sp.]MEA3220264.1 hypothetical protein [Immundisolibacter sp.]